MTRRMKSACGSRRDPRHCCRQLAHVPWPPCISRRPMLCAPLPDNEDFDTNYGAANCESQAAVGGLALRRERSASGRYSMQLPGTRFGGFHSRYFIAHWSKRVPKGAYAPAISRWPTYRRPRCLRWLREAGIHFAYKLLYSARTAHRRSPALKVE